MKRFLHLLFLPLLFASCISTEDTIYFQNGKFSTEEATLVNNFNTPYRIQPNDVLSIRVKSQDPKYSNYLNLEPEGGFTQLTPESLYVNGYKVSEEGYIHFPTIGELKVEALTVNEVRAMVQKAVDEEIQNSTVFVTLVSFKVAVLGEVRNPGYYFVYNEKANLLEVMALAGDIGQLANRKEIHLIRQTDKGSNVILLDLTDPAVLSSPYFYLLPNDVVYVPELKEKSHFLNLANLNIFSTVFSGVSTAITVLLLFR